MNDFIQRVAARVHWGAFLLFAFSTIVSLAMIVGYPLGMEMPNDPIGEVAEMYGYTFLFWIIKVVLSGGDFSIFPWD